MVGGWVVRLGGYFFIFVFKNYSEFVVIGLECCYLFLLLFFLGFFVVRGNF